MLFRSKILNKTTLKQLYYTFIYPYLSYCNIVWGNTYSTYLTKLLLLQKKIVRIVSFSAFRAHTSMLFKELWILKCREIYKYQVGQFIYKYKENNLPPLFSYMFSIGSDVHGHNTRSSVKFNVSRFSTELGRRAFQHDGLLFWNMNYENIPTCNTLNTFKLKLKSYLVDHQRDRKSVV